MSSGQKTCRQNRKCDIKMEDVIKVENATSMCIIQCKEKYKRTKYRGDEI